MRNTCLTYNIRNLKQIKSFATHIAVGANIATVVVTLLVGFSDRVSPVSHPLIANVGLLFPLFLALNIAFLVFWLIVAKRRAVISFAGLIAAYVPVRLYAPLNVPIKAPEGCVKVLSYNVFSFSTWKDLDAQSDILDYILRQDADIVCLQEADAIGRKREIIDSLMATRYPYSQVSGSLKPAGGDAIEVHSKFPITSFEHISTANDTYNAMAYRLLTAKNDTTLLIVCHFETTGLSPEDRTMFKSMVKGKLHTDTARMESSRLWHKLGEASARRAPQAEAVAAYVESSKTKNIILTGDFNDTPISYVHHRIAKTLTDCYVATANGPGISYHYNAFYVRIDNIFCSGAWTPYDCRVDNSIDASDHYPIVCHLKRKSTK